MRGGTRWAADHAVAVGSDWQVGVKPISVMSILGPPGLKWPVMGYRWMGQEIESSKTAPVICGNAGM